MKILITTDLYKPQINGVVTSIINLRSELEKEGHEVRILTISQQAASYKEDGVYYIKSLPIGVYPDIRFPISCASKFLKEIVEWKPEVIHSQCEFFSFDYAIRISKATKAPIVHTYHTLYEQYSKYLLGGKLVTPRILALFSKGRMKKVQTVIAPSEKVQKTLKKYKVKNHIEVIPTGIDLADFQDNEVNADIQKIRERYKIPKDRKIILSLGRLGFEKRIEEIIEGFALDEKVLQKSILLIVGDGPARKQLEELVREKQICNNVIFAGMVSPKEVVDYYKAADVFVCASTSETQGLTYVEAAASGLPLICKQDPCAKDLIKSGENGYVYQTVNEFSAYLQKLLNEDEMRQKANRTSRKLANRFGKEYFGYKIENVYKKTVHFESSSYCFTENYVELVQENE